ncbi:O-antigen ligase family protein [Paenibacillus albidus]|uniref:O-antigen ligase family protein n=1 Tax=Paenibacillus albidus TaxID=2041023 RepID=UPI00166A9034|nr:hypothetical protein [Paenibacillus albidus]
MYNKAFQNSNKIVKSIIDALLISVLSYATLFENIIFRDIFVLLLGLLCWGILIVRNYKEGFLFLITRMLVLSLPLSFVNVYGGSYEDLPLSWFNIFVGLLILVALINIFASRRFIIDHIVLSSSFMIIISLIPLITSSMLTDALKQYLNIILSFLIIIVGVNIKNKINNTQQLRLALDYITAVKIAAVGIFIQYISKNLFGVILGNFELSSGNRNSYSFLFTDFSFFSLFLSSGALMVFFVERTKIKSDKYWIFNMCFLLLASIISSARTGIVSFIVIFCLYSFFKFFHMVRNGSKHIFGIVFFNILVIISSYFLIVRVRSNEVLYDSGRNLLNEIAWRIFLDNPMYGIGFGINNYSKFGGILPHNLFFQFISQGGILYLVPLFLFLCSILVTCFKKYNEMFMVLLGVLFGALFIPDIFNSKFLPILFLMISLRQEPFINNKIEIK